MVPDLEGDGDAEGLRKLDLDTTADADSVEPGVTVPRITSDVGKGAREPSTLPVEGVGAAEEERVSRATEAEPLPDSLADSGDDREEEGEALPRIEHDDDEVAEADSTAARETALEREPLKETADEPETEGEVVEEGDARGEALSVKDPVTEEATVERGEPLAAPGVRVR